MSNELLDENENLSDATITPELQTLQRELREDLLGLVGNLSTRKREVVLLRYFGGLQNKEIAAVLDLDERTISAYLSRALSELQKELNQETKHLLLTREPRYD